MSFATVAGGAAGGAVMGGVRGALWGALTAGVAYGIGYAFNSGAMDSLFKGYINEAHALAHGVSGGALADAQGGKFSSGFYAAFFSQYANYRFGGGANSFERIARSAVIGGTASRLGGGKFENGAITSAFQTLFNELPLRERARARAHGRDPDDPRFGGDGGGKFPFIEGQGVSVMVGEDGITYVRATMRFVLENGAPFESETVIKRWVLGIEDYWSGTFDGMTIRTNIVVDQSASFAVTVPVIRGRGQSQHGAWFSGASKFDAAHEFGHILGLRDQYNLATGIPYPGQAGNIMASTNGSVWGRDIYTIREIARRGGYR